MKEAEYLAYHTALNISKQRDWLFSWYWCLFDTLLCTLSRVSGYLRDEIWFVGTCVCRNAFTSSNRRLN